MINKLVMATNAAFPPYEYVDGDGFAGIDVEIAQAIAIPSTAANTNVNNPFFFITCLLFISYYLHWLL